MSGAYGTLNVTESNLTEFVGGTTYNVTIDEDHVVSVEPAPAPVDDPLAQPPGNDEPTLAIANDLTPVDPGNGPGNTIAQSDEVAGDVDPMTELAEGSVTPATA